MKSPGMVVDLSIDAEVDDDAFARLMESDEGTRLRLADIRVGRVTTRIFGLRTPEGFCLQETSLELIQTSPEGA